MSKLTCFVLCAVAVSLGGVYAVSEEEKTAFQNRIKPVIDACSTEHGVSDVEIKSANEAGNAETVKPCFLGCVFKTIEVINSKGLYDFEVGRDYLAKFMNTGDELTKFEEIGKQCESVNDKPVSDGDVGCERATLLMGCIFESKVEIPL